MVSCLSQNGFEPALVLRIWKEMIGNPGYEPIPGLCAVPQAKFRLTGKGFAESGTTATQFSRDFARQLTWTFQGRPSPVSKGFPIDIT